MSRQTPSLSFEVFPPNPAVGNDKIISALQDMRELTPHFISVTASNNKFNIKETTVRLADFIQNDLANLDALLDNKLRQYQSEGLVP